MSIPDCINGTYEATGGLFLFYNCWRLFKDKKIRGVSIITTTFFTSWGVWNLYYYPSLRQWASFGGGCLIVFANALWLFLMLYYSKKEKHLTNNQKQPIIPVI